MDDLSIVAPEDLMLGGQQPMGPGGLGGFAPGGLPPAQVAADQQLADPAIGQAQNEMQ